MSLTGNASMTNELQGSVESGGEVRGRLAGLRFIQGLSAFEVAVLEGFSGTEEEWLASLKGEKGDPGYTPIKGKDYNDGYTPQKGIDYFDGYTPQKGVDYFDGYTPVKGVDYFDGEKGDPGNFENLTEEQKESLRGPRGEHGFSPQVNTTKVIGGTQLEITSIDNETGEEEIQIVTLADGEDGTSPIVAVTDIVGGHRVTVYDKNGSKSFDVMDGEHGDDGVFIATYGVTTYAEIKAAYDAGKMCLCKKANIILPMVLCSALNATFGTAHGGVIRTQIVNSEEVWSELTKPVLEKSGGTMTGALTLAADPTEDLHAATKAYVDAHAGGGGEPEVFVATYGETTYADIEAANAAGKLCFCKYSNRLLPAVIFTSGSIRFAGALSTASLCVLTVSAFDVWSEATQGLVKKTGDTLTGPLTLSADPTEAMHAATKQYVDSKLEENVELLGNSLPFVNETDNGKFLRVVNGAWAAAALESAEGGSF